MITYEWVDSLPADAAAEIAELLEAAAAYDEEAGFSTAAPAQTPAGADRRHLVVRMPPRGERGSAALDRLPDVSLVAYFRVDVRDGVGEGAFVVRPEFRSLGVGTLLFERLRDEDGWEGLRTLRIWAHGSHPAADRMSTRFGARLVDGIFKTLHLVGGSQAFAGEPDDLSPEPADVAVPESNGLPAEHLITLAPADLAALGRVSSALSASDGTVVCFGVDEGAPAARPGCIVFPEPDRVKKDVARNLLSHALLRVQESGARAVHLYVDPLNDDLLAASRELEFEHDQSDLRYELDLTR